MEQLAVHIDTLLDRLKAASQKEEDFCLLESGNESCEVILAIGSKSTFSTKTIEDQTINEFQEWIQLHPQALGWLGYDLKNGIEKLESNNVDYLDFPVIGFFSPIEILKSNEKIDWTRFTSKDIANSENQFSHNGNFSLNGINSLISKQEYLEKVNEIKAHIQAGDVYELNYCQGFVGSTTHFDALTTYARLSLQTQAPMSGLMSLNGYHILSGSPERFLKKTGQTLVSQPIKGTRPRGTTSSEDEKLKDDLRKSQKDKSENVMITDLVRNDLSKIATPKSVKVEELFGVYSFPTVHQMISTVSCELRPEANLLDILRATFPMGSMTGAPKISAMKLIERFENFRRGPFSGALGYIDEKGNFDFNVLIRSIFHNSETGAIATFAGGAITAESDPEDEYAESMHKANSMLKALK